VCVKEFAGLVVTPFALPVRSVGGYAAAARNLCGVSLFASASDYGKQCCDDC